MKTARSKSVESKPTCTMYGNHRYHFQQIIQPVYHNAVATSPALSPIGTARLVQACECGHTLVKEL